MTHTHTHHRCVCVCVTCVYTLSLHVCSGPEISPLVEHLVKGSFPSLSIDLVLIDVKLYWKMYLSTACIVIGHTAQTREHVLYASESQRAISTITTEY